jgi:hypothetical protein
MPKQHTKGFYTKKGRSIRVLFSWSQHLHRLHIVQVVDGDMVVYKFFGRHKQWWHYGVERWQRIKFYHEQGIEEKQYETTTGKNGG